jgi:hypothetical protein
MHIFGNISHVLITRNKRIEDELKIRLNTFKRVRYVLKTLIII